MYSHIRRQAQCEMLFGLDFKHEIYRRFNIKDDDSDKTDPLPTPIANEQGY